MTLQSKDRRYLLLLTVLCLFLFFFQLGARALWDVDEGMHALSAKLVVESGDWVTPIYNGEPFFDKPMFFTWLVALSFALLGFTELAARLPAALLALAGVLLTYWLARQMLGSRAAVLGGAALASSFLFLVMARTVVHDSALAFFTTLALALFYRAVQDPEGRKLYFLLFYVALSGAVLAKGPLGIVLPGLVIGPFLLLTRRLRLLVEMRLGWGVAIVILLAGPWYLMMELRNEGYLQYLLLEKSFGSFAAEETTHPEPFHFYIPVLLGAVLPWSGFLPIALWRAIRRLTSGKRDEFLFLLLWLGGMFLFFSLASSKLASYLLPLMPAAAILIGAMWDEALDAPQGPIALSLVWWHAPLTLLMLTGLVYGLIEPPLEYEVKYGVSPVQLLAVGLLISLGPVVTLLLLLRRRLWGAFASLVAVVAAVLVVFGLWMGPAMNDYRSSRELAREADPLFPPGQPLVFFWREKDSALFYTDRNARILHTGEVEEYLQSEQEVFFIADVRELHLLAKHRQNLAVIHKRGSKVVLSNRPESERPEMVPPGFERQ